MKHIKWVHQYAHLNYAERVAISDRDSHNMTLLILSLMNNVPYRFFEKYLKANHGVSDIYPISIIDVP